MSTSKALVLKKRCELVLQPTIPFHFTGTVWKMSHFPSPIEVWDGQVIRFTMRLGMIIYGIRLSSDGTALRVKVFSDRQLSKKRELELLDELKWRFDMEMNTKPFLEMAFKDSLLQPVVRHWQGMRVKCAQNLYELLVIGVVLQNATVRRSIQMFGALLESFGVLVEFDGIRQYAFWVPEALVEVDEEAFRALKLGYRAKTLVRQVRHFTQPGFDEMGLRLLSDPQLRKELMQIYGVGPATSGILEFERFHRYDAVNHISPWEHQIYSHLLFDREFVPIEQINDRIEKWRPWRMLALHVLFEDLFWRHASRPVGWLTPLIRL